MHYSQNKRTVLETMGIKLRCERDMTLRKSIERRLPQDDPRRVKFYKFSGIRGASNLDIRKIRCFYGCNHEDDCPGEKPYPDAPVIDVPYVP